MDRKQDVSACCMKEWKPRGVFAIVLKQCMKIQRHICGTFCITVVPHEFEPSSQWKVKQRTYKSQTIILNKALIQFIDLNLIKMFLKVWAWYHIAFCVYICTYTQLGTCKLHPLTFRSGTTNTCWSVKVNISQWIRQGKALLECDCIAKAKQSQYSIESISVRAVRLTEFMAEHSDVETRQKKKMKRENTGCATAAHVFHSADIMRRFGFLLYSDESNYSSSSQLFYQINDSPKQQSHSHYGEHETHISSCRDIMPTFSFHHNRIMWLKAFP